MEIEFSDDNFRIRRARSFRERPEKTSEGLRRVRSFKTTSKGLVNRGDSFKSKKNAAAATEYGGSQHDHSEVKAIKAIKVDYLIPKLTMTRSEDQNNYFRVLMLGTEGVGKSSIIDQFMTSDFLGSGCFNVCKYILNISHFMPLILGKINKQKVSAYTATDTDNFIFVPKLYITITWVYTK